MLNDQKVAEAFEALTTPPIGGRRIWAVCGSAKSGKTYCLAQMAKRWSQLNRPVLIYPGVYGIEHTYRACIEAGAYHRFIHFMPGGDIVRMLGLERYLVLADNVRHERDLTDVLRQASFAREAVVAISVPPVRFHDFIGILNSPGTIRTLLSTAGVRHATEA